MNITQKVITSISGVALAGVLTFGATASAADPGDDDGTGNGNHPRAEYICNHQSEISARLAKAKTRIEERITKLTERRAEAVEAGNTDAVARIDKRVERLNRLLDRVTKRATQLPVWVAAHCDPAS
jgi:hypothetical protein